MASQLTLDTTIFSAYAAGVEERALRLPLYALIRTSLIATLLAAPLAFGAVQAWAWAAMAVAAFLLFLLWSIAGVRQGVLRILWSPLYLPAGLFFLLGMIQFAGRLTMDPIATREALLKLVTDLILFFLAGQIFAAPASGPPRNLGPNGRLRLKAASATGRVQHQASTAGPYVPGGGSAALRWTLVLYAFLLALFAILQFFSSDRLIFWMVQSPGWTFGPYVNHNHYAGLMEMLIPLSVASALPAIRKHPSAAVLGCVLLIPIASLLLSGSRGGLIALLVEVLLATVLVFGCGPRHARKVTTLVWGGALVAAVLLFFWMAPSHVVERLARIGDGTHPRDVELGHRLVVSRDTLGVLRDHPWLGVGLGSFESAFPRYQSLPSDLRWDHAHNDYAEALAETGLSGGVVIVSALIMFFWLAFRNLRQRLRRPTGWMQFAAAVGCCGILVHSFADFNLHMPANAAWFVVCVALATSSYHRRGTEAQRLKK
jgi:O-antigen ligase